MLGALFICMENGQTKALTTGKCAIVCIWLGKKENFLFSVSILHQCRGTSTSIVYVLRSLEWCLRGFCHLLPARFPRNAVVWLVLWERVETKRGRGGTDATSFHMKNARTAALFVLLCDIEKIGLSIESNWLQPVANCRAIFLQPYFVSIYSNMCRLRIGKSQKPLAVTFASRLTFTFVFSRSALAILEQAPSWSTSPFAHPMQSGFRVAAAHWKSRKKIKADNKMCIMSRKVDSFVAEGDCIRDAHSNAETRLLSTGI